MNILLHTLITGKVGKSVTERDAGHSTNVDCSYSNGMRLDHTYILDSDQH